MKKDLDDSYVKLLHKWQEEQEDADRFYSYCRTEKRFERVCGAVLGVLMVITLFIAYFEGV